MSAAPLYKILFMNQDKIYELYARGIYQSEMYGFIEAEEFVFGERSQVIVDPVEDRLKNEFAGVNRSYIPMHAIIRIDEVEKEGISKITDSKGDGNIASFPVPSGARPVTDTTE